MNKMGDVFIDFKTSTIYFYKKITVKQLLYYKTKYKHVEVRERNRKKW